MGAFVSLTDGSSNNTTQDTGEVAVTVFAADGTEDTALEADSAADTGNQIDIFDKFPNALQGLQGLTQSTNTSVDGEGYRISRTATNTYEIRQGAYHVAAVAGEGAAA
ncbi:hypothetical protein K1X76_12135, partial [bacterium]|nr:hypothetical protein [bacterium]